MNLFIPWLRAFIAPPLGFLTIELFHLVLVLILAAGTLGSFVAATLAGPRLRLSLALFFLLMLALDLSAILADFAPQPPWFKTLVLGTLPLQVWLGSKPRLLHPSRPK